MTIEAKYGVPTVAMHTDKFDRVVRSVASVNGMAGLRQVFVPQPVMGKSARELRAYVDGTDPLTGRPVMQEVIEGLTAPPNGEGVDRIEYDPSFNSATNKTLSWFADTDVDKVYAGFANVSYDVTSALEASLALRYDKDDASQSVDPRNTGGVPPGCTVAPGGNCLRATSFDRFQPKVSLKYQLTPDAQVYASWGEGFRSGLYNPYGTSGVAASNGLVGISDTLPAGETFVSASSTQVRSPSSESRNRRTLTRSQLWTA